ncbi:MAG: Hsp33 family molecular chaperone HslO [Oscillospiraceae bacterium]|nr:Hsp33 family molecular chaperone HslO [Oscillospiraceae bacterium]
MNNIERYISEDGSVVVTVINSKKIVEEIKRIHSPSKGVLVALGRLATITSMMGYNLKDDSHNLTVRISGNGTSGSLVAYANSKGNTKCYAQNEKAGYKTDENNSVIVPSVVGKEGTLSVMKDIGLKQPHIGNVRLVTGEIAEDISAYYVLSEQTGTACGVGVHISEDGEIYAGGYLIHLLPLAPAEMADILEENILKMGSIWKLFKNQVSLEEIGKMCLKNLNPNVLDRGISSYKCNCSKEKIDKSIITVGKEELIKILQEEKKLEASCHFCNKVIRYTLEDIENIF